MAFLSAFYPQPVVAGTTAGTYAAGDDSRITGAAQKVGAVDIEITDATKGLILKSANNNRYRLTIDNDGIPTTTAL
jgi:hypothetical protein